MPDTDFRSVSIITQDSGYADLLSTAAFLMPYEESRACVDSLDGVEAIWLFPDGSKKMTFGAMNVAKSCGASNRYVKMPAALQAAALAINDSIKQSLRKSECCTMRACAMPSVTAGGAALGCLTKRGNARLRSKKRADHENRMPAVESAPREKQTCRRQIIQQ